MYEHHIDSSQERKKERERKGERERKKGRKEGRDRKKGRKEEKEKKERKTGRRKISLGQFYVSCFENHPKYAALPLNHICRGKKKKKKRTKGSIIPKYG